MIDRILTGDTADQVAFMIEHAIDQVWSYSIVKRAVALAGEDVGAVSDAHDCRPKDLWRDCISPGVGILGYFEIPFARG